MQVKKKKTGEVEGLSYDEAQAAVTAGTHEFVNVGQDGKPKAEKDKQPKQAAKS